jgi:hypothetical protein
MHSLRTFILKGSTKTIKSFSFQVLTRFWTHFHIYCWNNRLNFSKFKGNELNQFVENCSFIKSYLENEFVQTEEVKNLGTALSLLPLIFNFLSITYIENPKKYLEEELPDFENNLKLFIKSGRYSFLLNDEPFYFHCMRYYLPTIARQTFHSFQLGLGIFNMQGFERRNKESKTLLHRACNNKRSSKAMLRNNLRRLLINFWYQ